ncbi:killer cell lectin-like receptor subfamily B member 1B allele C [Gadus macrocephalus]|uniref:killer cell lectin-like receptor subfamily B member 1B allele C n=1 Tax=Gadus macrocephalus TaxID=80720 RepID=UPI0028CB596C|nr:killer cell lectin-like receptor subfamily B member 1B allele C [Gadus macrocephalus]
MEMKAMEVEVEAGLLDRAGPSDQKRETKTEAKEASKEYCKLKAPADDIYSEAVFPSPKLPEVKPTKPTRSLRNVLPTLCIVLGVICLAELIIIFILNGKTAPTLVCPGPWRDPVPPLSPKSPCFKNPKTPTTKSPDSQRCSDNWVFLEGSCFYQSKERNSWEEGRIFCQNLTGDLAVISDSAAHPALRIQNSLAQQIKVPHWIGLQYKTSWKWVDNRTPYTGNLPTGTEELCAILESKTPRMLEQANIRDARCPVSAHFICQKEASLA